MIIYFKNFQLKLDDNLDINDENKENEGIVKNKNNHEDESNGFIIVSEEQNQKAKKNSQMENNSKSPESENLQQTQILNSNSSKKNESSNIENNIPAVPAQKNTLSHYNRGNQTQKEANQTFDLYINV